MPEAQLVSNLISYVQHHFDACISNIASNCVPAFWLSNSKQNTTIFFCGRLCSSDNNTNYNYDQESINGLPPGL